MRLIFLDIDGVMNSEWSFMEAIRKNREPDLHFAERSVEMIKDAVKATKAKIVISSTWRYDMQKVFDAFNYNNMDCTDIIDSTPYIDRAYRGVEIARYLDELCEFNVDGIAILDDDMDLDPLMCYLIQTEPKYGLHEGHYGKILRMLNKPIRSKLYSKETYTRDIYMYTDD